jgi:hypothetical protein
MSADFDALVRSLDRVCPACVAATSQETWDLLHRDRTCVAVARVQLVRTLRGIVGALQLREWQSMYPGEFADRAIVFNHFGICLFPPDEHVARAIRDGV